jgi:hypothetical protein
MSHPLSAVPPCVPGMHEPLSSLRQGRTACARLAEPTAGGQVLRSPQALPMG